MILKIKFTDTFFAEYVLSFFIIVVITKKKLGRDLLTNVDMC